MNFSIRKRTIINSVRKLEINENPPLISYTHNAFQSAIISSNAIAGNRVVEYIINEDTASWNSRSINGELETEIVSTVYSDMKHELGYVLQYRPLREIDCITLKIISQRKMCVYEVLDLVLYEHEPNLDSVMKEPGLRYGFSGVEKMFLEINKQSISMTNYQRVIEYPFYLRLIRNNSRINLQFSQNGKNWKDAYTDKLPEKMKYVQLYAGVLTEIRNEYLNWKSQNHIQISSGHPFPNEIYADYYLGPTKNFKPFVSNHYLDFYDEFYNYSSNKYKWFKMISERIHQGIYIIIDIDHYYIKETEYYMNQHRFHQVMIYGVNIRKKTYYILGYGEKNAMVHYEMSRSALCKALCNEEVKFTCCRIDINLNPCKFDPVIIKKRLQEYLQKRRSDIDVTDVFPMMLSDNSGIDVYCSLLEDSNELYIFCHNPRLSFFFYEHKRLMLERFEYIKTKIYVNDERIKEIQTCLESNLNDSLIVKNLVLMNSMKTNRKQLMTKVKSYIERIVENEKKAYNLICDLLDIIQCNKNS